jgi:alpha-ketoglutarate-dependent taurine dioxygenase
MDTSPKQDAGEFKLGESSEVRIRNLTDAERSFPTLENHLPLVITPKGDPGYGHLVRFVKSQGNLLKETVNRYGAILLRGFEIPQISCFGEILESMGYELSKNYSGGFAPRHQVEKNIFTSVEIKNEFPIFAHNEMTYQNNMPAIVSFFCQKEPPKFGETPLFNGAGIYRSLPPDLRKLLDKRKIKYVRKYREKWPLIPHRLSRGWQQMFETEDKEQINQLCQENGARCLWGPRDSLKIETVTEPFITHPLTGEKCFSVQLLNAYGVAQDIKNLGARVDRMLRAYGILMTHLAFKLGLVPMQTSFGNGEPIPKKISLQIWNAIWKHVVVFQWRQNDILVLDNLKTLHAKLNVVQPRKILFAMGDMTNLPRTVAG